MSALRVGLLAGLIVGGVFAQEAPKMTPNKTYQSALNLLAEGQQKNAEDLVEEACINHPESQPLLFLRGVLERSRFHRDDAFQTFSKVYALDADSVQGRAALTSTSMDFDMGIEGGLGELRSLIESHPDEILLRWLFAIQCRTHRKYSEEAEVQYLIILEEWNPAPVMVNHTYANILTESLGRPEEALVYRERALEQVQRGWTYQGYANTLRKLGRYEEASAAFEKAVKSAPKHAVYWSQWGNCLLDSGQVKEAYKVFRKAYDTGLRDPEILEGLGRANELGRGTAKNDIQAVGWYKLAAEGSGEAMYRLGRMREDGRGEPKNYAAAAEWYRRAIAADYDRPRPDLARLYAAGGYGLDRDLRKVEELFRGFPARSSTGGSRAETSHFAGLVFTRKNGSDYQSAVLDYDGTDGALRRRMSKGDDEAGDLLAWLYAVNPNFDPNLKGAAVNLAEGLCRKDSENPRWRNTLAAAYAREGKFNQAVEQQKVAIRLLTPERMDSEDGRAYAERLELYISERPYTTYCGEVGVKIESIVSKTPTAVVGSPGYLFKEGWAFQHGKGVEKDYAAAMECYRKSVKKGDSPAWMQMGKIYLKGGFGIDRDIEKAAGFFEHSIAGRSLPEESQTMGIEKLVMKRSGGGFSVDYFLTEAFLKEPSDRGDEEAVELLAWIYAACESPRYHNGGEAVRLAEKLCRKDENNPQWRNTLAAAYARAGKYSKAVEQQQQAIALLSEKRKSSQEGIAYSSRLELYREKNPFPPDE